MPGPPVRTILTSDDIGLGTYEMKVKGTYVIPGNNKAITSRYLFISEEEEQEFFDAHPEYKKDPQYIDLEDNAPVRGLDVPYQVKNQKKEIDYAGDVPVKIAKKPVSPKLEPKKKKKK